MSSVLTNIRGLFGPPDPRSEHEIDDDLDAEFAFHIEQLEAELIEQGVPPEHAPELARARFGNQEKLKQRCKTIAMKERIMLQRINTVLMVIVMLAVVGVSIQMYVTQRHNTLALLDITSQIATMRIEADTEARQVAAADQGAQHAGVDEQQAPAPGLWRQVLPNGSFVPDGYEIIVLSTDDIRNLERAPSAVLAVDDVELRMVFLPEGGLGLNEGRPHLRLGGRWTLDNHVLAVNASRATPQLTEPLLFRHVDDLER